MEEDDDDEAEWRESAPGFEEKSRISHEYYPRRGCIDNVALNVVMMYRYIW